MRIKDVLRRKGDLVVTISPDEHVGALLDALAEHKVGALVVAGAGGSVEGIVSERDVVRHLQARGAGVLEERVSSIMTSPVHTAEPDTTLDELIRRQPSVENPAPKDALGRGGKQATRP